MRLILIRHAPTNHNVKGIFCGCSDVDVCEDTFLQEVSRLKINVGNSAVVWSSPLKRAYLTASALFPSLKIYTDNRLMERGLGAWEGRNKSEVRRDCPEAFLHSGLMHPLYSPPGGEDFFAVKSRVLLFLIDLKRQHENTDLSCDIFIISHNYVIRMIKYLLTDRSETLYSKVLHMAPVFFQRDDLDYFFSKEFSRRNDVVFQVLP